jgi:hypothetical protein
MSKYGLLDPGTCLPVLEALCHVYEINEALEFGAGLWSTFCLTRTCKSVTSIENVADWCDTVRNNYGYRNNLNVIHWTDPMNEFLKTTDKSYDLIFVDGNDRVQCLNDSIDRSPIIVCHDTHQAVQNWKDAIIPDTYKQLTYTGCLPYYTTIFHHVDLDLETRLLDQRSYVHKGTFIDSNFWSSENIIAMYKQQSS